MSNHSFLFLCCVVNLPTRSELVTGLREENTFARGQRRAVKVQEACGEKQARVAQRDVLGRLVVDNGLGRLIRRKQRMRSEQAPAV